MWVRGKLPKVDSPGSYCQIQKERSRRCVLLATGLVSFWFLHGQVHCRVRTFRDQAFRVHSLTQKTSHRFLSLRSDESYSSQSCSATTGLLNRFSSSLPLAMGKTKVSWGKTKVSGTVFAFFGPSMGSESAFQAKTGDNIRSPFLISEWTTSLYTFSNRIEF